MDREELIILSASLIAFVAIAGVVIAVGMELQRRQAAGGRLKTKPKKTKTVTDPKSNEATELVERLSQSVDVDLLSGLVSHEKRTKLRIDLIRAGFFDAKAPALFIGFTIFSIFMSAIMVFLPFVFFYLISQSYCSYLYLAYVLTLGILFQMHIYDRALQRLSKNMFLYFLIF
jgi:hypothetical protein